MFSKAHRLKKQKNFDKIFKKKCSVATSGLVMYILPRPARCLSDEPSKFGILVSKKIDKRATRRNRIKRLVREAIKELLETEASLFNEVDSVILIARPPIANKSLHEVRGQVYGCLKKSQKYIGKQVL